MVLGEEETRIVLISFSSRIDESSCVGVRHSCVLKRFEMVMVDVSSMIFCRRFEGV